MQDQARHEWLVSIRHLLISNERTLHRLQRLGVKRVRVVCRNCRHTAELDVWEMIKTVGMGRRVDSLRFKCRNCGKHRVEFRMVSETEDHKPVVGDSWQA